ncbi:MAG: hypothetical protein PVH61_04990 [Candidatus Aminicenantes bacterium]|jgi:hypothetical protein
MKTLNRRKGVNQSPILVTLIGFLIITGWIYPGEAFAAGTNQNEQKKKKVFQPQPLTLKKSILTKTINYQVLKQRTQSRIQQLHGKGPDGAQMIKLNEIIDIDAPAEFTQDNIDQIFSLSPMVFQDINNDQLKKKIYYYLPGKYFLSWNHEDGYLLRFYYKGEVKSGGKPSIHIDLWLTPGHKPEDYQLLKKLIGVHTRATVKDLIRLPADYSLSLKLGAQEIPQEQITTSQVDSDSGEITAVIETDVVTKEMLTDQLADLGWPADMVIRPASYSQEAQPVPTLNRLINIRLCDREAYTQKKWRRGSGEFSHFTNEYDFPIELRHLFFLRETTRKSLKIYGFKLGNAVILPGQTAKINNRKIPDALDDNQTLKAWFDFRLIKNDHYLKRVLEEITGGLGEVPIKTLNLVAVNPDDFHKYNIFEISVQVNSRYFDPAGERTILKSYKLSKDNAKITGDSFYILADSGSQSLGPLFKYKISIIDNNANRYTDATWRQPEAGEDTIYIGENQLKELMGDQEAAAGDTSGTTGPTPAAGESTDLAITSISPSSVTEGEPFTLEIHGTGFQPGAKVYIKVNINAGDESAEPEYADMEFDCVYVGSTQLKITFERGFGADPSQRDVYVQNPDSSRTNVVYLNISSGTD